MSSLQKATAFFDTNKSIKFDRRLNHLFQTVSEDHIINPPNEMLYRYKKVYVGDTQLAVTAGMLSGALFYDIWDEVIGYIHKGDVVFVCN